MTSTKFYLSKQHKVILKHLGEVILGVPREKLPEEYISEAELFIGNLEEFLQSDLKRLLTLFNSRFLSFFMILSIKPFTKMDLELKQRFFEKWVYSRIGLLRTGASTLRALCGWSYYSLEAEWEKMNYPGNTIGREDKTPTLLFGQKPWSETQQEENT